MTRTFGSTAAVIAAIQEDARSEVDRLTSEADRATEGPAAAERGPVDAPDRDIRLAAARRDASERIARAEWLDMRAALEAREQWIAEAVVRGRRRLQQESASDAGPDMLAALAAEAIAWLRAVVCEVIVDPRDHARLDERWRQELARRTGCADLRVLAGPAGGGCVVRTVDGRASFDNTWEARDRRFAHEWRAALGRLYEGTEACRTTSPAA